MNSNPDPKFDVLAFGVVAVDDLLSVASYPDADDKTEVDSEERYCGGLAATAMVAVARLGGRAAYGGVLDDDELSRFVLDTLTAENVDVSLVQKQADARPVYARIVVGRDRQTRNIFYRLKEAVPVSTDSINEALVRSTRVLFVDQFGIEAMTLASEIAVDAGIPRVADFERGDYPGFDRLLELIDHPILPRDFALKLTGTKSPDDACRALWNDQRSVVVVTGGEQGCWYFDGQGVPTHVPAFSVNAVETTGCGDVFHGAYALTLAEGLDLTERIRLASAAAALTATQPGGQAGIPDRATVEVFMK
jgi:sulfofructose kinase